MSAFACACGRGQVPVGMSRHALAGMCVGMCSGICIAGKSPCRYMHTFSRGNSTSPRGRIHNTGLQRDTATRFKPVSNPFSSSMIPSGSGQHFLTCLGLRARESTIGFPGEYHNRKYDTPCFRSCCDSRSGLILPPERQFRPTDKTPDQPMWTWSC